MATISTFEDLEIWKLARQQAIEIFRLYETGAFSKDWELRNQINGSSGSVMDNIAEGFERGSKTELIQFLYIAKGSAGECRSMLRLCEHSPRFLNFKFEISNLISRAKNISGQLNGWLESLRDSKIKGLKYLTGAEREKLARDKEFAEFDAQMAEFRREHLEILIKRQQDTAITDPEMAGDITNVAA